jgi:tRNA-modifying protein YgfZ
VTEAGPRGSQVFDRSGRARILVEGRAPAQMLLGMVTGTMPRTPRPAEAPGWSEVDAPESLVLTPKGRIVTDLRLVALEPGASGAHLLELPAAGLTPLMAHFERYLPPRFARPRDLSDTTRMLTVAGPDAAAQVARATGLAPDQVEALGPGAARVRGTLDGGDFLAVIATASVHPPAFDIVGTPGATADVESGLEAEGVRRADPEAWHALRIERGTPETGQELDESVLPPEAGLEKRAIDHTKGCYTGQEVIVRIRDRGRVNRHLRGLELGTLSLPAPGTRLFAQGTGKEVGEVRSSARSERLGGGIALGFVRREVEPGEAVHLGDPEGAPIRVRALGPTGWEVPERAANEARTLQEKG